MHHLSGLTGVLERSASVDRILPVRQRVDVFYGPLMFHHHSLLLKY